MLRSLALLIGLGSCAAAAIADGLTLYLPLDGTVDPRSAASRPYAQAMQATWTEGRQGKALGGGLSVNAAGILDRSCGSLAFWIRPEWEQSGARNIDLAGAPSFALQWETGKRLLFFMTASMDTQAGFAWGYETTTDAPKRWTPGTWHHCALTWDAASKGKTLWIDGACVARTSNGRFNPTPSHENERLSFGRHAAIDEILVWRRVLTDEEIRGLASDPSGSASTIVKTAPPPEVGQVWPVRPVAKLSLQEVVRLPGTPLALPIRLESMEGKPWQGEVRCTLIDWRGDVHAEWKRSVQVPASSKAELDTGFVAPSQRGAYAVAVSIVDQGRVLLRDVGGFAVWPQPAPANPFFGHHVFSFLDGPVALAQRLGIAQTRGHNMLQVTWWPRVEPEPGTLAWGGIDQLARCEKAGIGVLGQIFGTPWWAAASGPMPRPKDGNVYPSGARPDPEALRKHVRTVVSRYAERIRAWEVWNEPDVSMFWNGTPAQLAEVVTIASAEMRRVDPRLTVMAPGVTQVGRRWLEQFAAAGGLVGLDAISFHAYHDVEDPAALEVRLADLCGFLRSLSKRTLGRELALWDTESGSSDAPRLRGLDRRGIAPPGRADPREAERAAWAAVQHAALLMEQGVVRSYAYVFAPQLEREYDALNFIDADNSPKAKTLARQAMAELTRDAVFVAAVRKNEARCWVGVWRRQDGNSLLLGWTGWDGRAQMAVEWPAAPARAWDLMGNAATPVPGPWKLAEEPGWLHIPAPPEAVLEHLRRGTITVQAQARIIASSPAAEGARIWTGGPYPAALEARDRMVPIDLRSVATMGFLDLVAGDGRGGWTDEGPLNSIASITAGRTVFLGVPFELIDPAGNGGRSVITLQGTKVTPGMPEAVRGIQLGGRTARSLFLLTAGAWCDQGRAIATVSIRYADGGVVAVPLVPGTNTGDWWSGQADTEESRTVAVRTTATADGRPAWRYWRIWEWQNPAPARAVQSLDIVSACGPATPIVIGVTLLP